MKKELPLSYARVRAAAFCYMGLPFLIFAMGWLSLVPALLSAAVTVAILILAVKPCRKKQPNVPSAILLNSDGITHIRIPRWTVLAVALIAAVWVFWSGIGGLFYQSDDFPFRNAVFRDLLTYKWPVIYGGEKGMLSYYIGFWLPAAVVGKFFGLFIHNADAIWHIGNAALYLWAVAGIVLVFLMFCFNVNANSRKKVLYAALIFVFFSGMDIVGWFAAGADTVLERLTEANIHIEWWAKFISFPSGHLMQFSSFTTQLFWVFNQAVVAWLATLTLFREKTPSNFVFIGMMALFCGPIPFYGFFVLALTLGIRFFWRTRRHPKFAIFSFVSPQNVLALLGVFPVCYAYFTCNTAANIQGDSKMLRYVPRLILNFGGRADMGVSPARLWLYIAFLLLEFLLIALLIWWRYRKELPFWVCCVMLCLCPMIFTGAAADFCMRASIPALVVLCVYTVRFLFENFHSPKHSLNRLICMLLTCFLILGAFTPLVEMYRGVVRSVAQGRYITYNDTFKTLASDEKSADSVRNFTAQHYENSTFYTYLARHNNDD